MEETFEVCNNEKMQNYIFINIKRKKTEKLHSRKYIYKRPLPIAHVCSLLQSEKQLKFIPRCNLPYHATAHQKLQVCLNLHHALYIIYA